MYIYIYTYTYIYIYIYVVSGDGRQTPSPGGQADREDLGAHVLLVPEDPEGFVGELLISAPNLPTKNLPAKILRFVDSRLPGKLPMGLGISPP